MIRKMDRNSPDWVMVGIPLPNGKVRLLASKELNEAELRTEADDRWNDPYLYQRSPTYTYYLTASMWTFVLIEAADYPTAFEALFKQWSPEPKREKIGDRKQIESYVEDGRP